jgi:hypothetical protein
MIRRDPNLSEKLACVLLLLKVGDEWLIPEPIRSSGSAKDIIALIQFDHDPIPYANGGGTQPQNLTPRSVAQHREKTATVDLPRIAKGKRLARSAKETRRIILARIGQLADAEVNRRKRKHPLPCGKASGWKKPMNGNAVRRTKP